MRARASGSRSLSGPAAAAPVPQRPAVRSGAQESRDGLGHSLGRVRVFPQAPAPSRPPPPPAAVLQPSGRQPIQTLPSREDLSRYWRGVKNYLNPANAFGRRTRAASHYGSETDEIADEVDRSLRVVSPARLLLRRISPWHRNRPDEVTRSDRNEINRLLQDVHMQGSGRRAPQTGIRISTAFLDKRDQPEARRETTRDLIRIARTRSGRELLRGLHSGAQGRRKLGVSIESQRRAEIDDPNAGRADPMDSDALGRGRPTGSNVFYIPSGLRDLRGRGRDRVNPWNDPARGDVSLYHELVHAHHQQRGGSPATHRERSLVPIARRSARHPVDEGVPHEEYRTVGLSARFRGDRFHENRYRQELRELGQDVRPRNTYNLVEPEEDDREPEGGFSRTGQTSRLLDSDDDRFG